MKNLINFFLVFTCSATIYGQSIQGRVVDSESKEALYSANVLLQGSAKGTVTNEDGEFLLNYSNADSITISYLGYQTITLAIKDMVESENREIGLEYLGYNLPGVVISDLSARGTVDLMMNNIKKNYPQKEHLSKGFYKEELIHEDGTIFTYGEASINTLKKKYHSKPSGKDLYSSSNLETAVFEKGFFENFYEVMIDEKDNEYLFPVVFGGGTIAVTLDILKSEMSFLLKETIDYYEFQFDGMVIDGDQSAFIIDFKPKNDGRLYGELVIDDTNYALLSATFYASDSLLNMHNSTEKLAHILSRKFQVNYKNTENGYVLNDAMAESKFLFVPTGDQLINRIHYVTVESVFDGKFEFDEKNKISSFEGMESLVPEEEDYWAGQNIILRSEKIENVLQEKKKRDATLKQIDFTKASYAQVKKQAQEENKLIFVDVYADWCAPCKHMDKTTFQDPAIVEKMESDYVAYKLDLDRNRNHTLVRTLNVASIPRLIIVSPWGQVLYQMNGYRDAARLSPVLDDLSEHIRIEEIASKLTGDSEKDDEMVAAGELLKQLTPATYKSPEYVATSVLKKSRRYDENQLKFLFEWLFLLDKEYQDYFYENVDDFKKLVDTEEVNAKLYDLGISKLISKQLTPSEVLDKFEAVMEDEYDFYRSMFEIDYYTYVDLREEKRVAAMIDHYTKFPDQNWDDVKLIFANEVFKTDHRETLSQLLEALKVYQSVAVDYEWNDIKCLILYKLGKEEEAFKMMGEIKQMALDQGVNYKSLIYQLRK